jgi:hypothetical protein
MLILIPIVIIWMLFLYPYFSVYNDIAITFPDISKGSHPIVIIWMLFLYPYFSVYNAIAITFPDISKGSDPTIFKSLKVCFSRFVLTIPFQSPCAKVEVLYLVV